MIVQFYDIKDKKTYCDGWPFPHDCEDPEGDWIRVTSRKRVSLETLKRKAKKIMREKIKMMH